jgi:hypothetical protein
MFYGFGIAASFSRSKDNIHEQYTYDTVIYTNDSKSVSDSWSAGVSGILGAEWFFAKNMSLLGEYSTVASYGGETRKSERRSFYNGQTTSFSSSEDKRNSVRISSSSVKFGLSIYF